MTRPDAQPPRRGNEDCAYEFRPTQWPDWSARRGHPESERRARRGGILGGAASLVFYYYLFEGIAGGGYSALRIAAIALSVLAYGAGYVYAVARGTGLSHRGRVYLVIALFALGALPAVLTGDPTALTYWTFALVVTMTMLPLRASRLIVLGAVATEILSMWLVDGSVRWGLVWILFSVGMGMSAVFALIHTVTALRAARSEIRELAVAEERERMARDLHDILGHSLTTVTVKAGLARRLLQQGDGGEQAAGEVADIEELGRQALADVRATVSDYRTPSLSAEIAGARMSLQAAQITADLPHAVDNVAPELQELFGYVVREAVTNVIRHSHADRCEVRLGDRWVEVVDNGAPASGDGTGADGNGTDGNGLRGLRERVARLGGGLAAARAEGGGFRVLVTVPAAQGATAAGREVAGA